MMIGVNSLIMTLLVVGLVIGLLLLLAALDSRRIAKKMYRDLEDGYELRRLRAEYIENKEKGK
jgi:hypothetical protein